MSLFHQFQSENIKFYYCNPTYNPIKNPKKSWNFILEYFKLGGKEKAFDLDFFEKLKKNGKHIHTVSMYYIGCLLIDVIEADLSGNLKELIPGLGEQFNYKFIYSWFLTCLYHDTASIIEDTVEPLETIGIPKYHYEEMLKKYKIEYDVFDHRWTRQNYTRQKHFTYSRLLVKNYYYYSLVTRRKIEHGILGGLILFDRLKKNYDEKLTQYKREFNIEESEQIENFNLNGLSWRIQHLDHFAYIADSIISHNIWCSKDVKLYEKFGLLRLKEPVENKVCIKKNSLLFFLAIVDTIEPTKFFNQFQPQFVWKNIDMSYDKDSYTIKIQVLGDMFNIEKWFEKIKSLETWLHVEVVPQQSNIIMINIKR